MSGSTPTLIATDLDGTLLNPAGEVTEFTRSVLERVWQRGIDTLFVTARPPRWIDDLADAVGGHGHAICANGAFLYDVTARTVVESQLIAPDVTAALVADLRRDIPGIGFAMEHSGGMHREEEYGRVDPAWVGHGATCGPVGEVPSRRGIGKLLARVPRASAQSDESSGPGAVQSDDGDMAFIARVREVVGDRAVVNYSGACGLAEIGPSGVSKASALATWCERRGVAPEHVWAFGDMPNDIPMLQWAGRSFAVAGAHPSVVQAATDTCGPNDDDGVARTLLSLLD